MAIEFGLKPGLKGFLITCFKSREAVTTKEAYSLFEKFESDPKDSEPNMEIKDLPIEEALKMEVAKIKDRRGKIFLAINLRQVPCMVFISSQHPLPPTKILEEIEALNLPHTKYIQRIIPVNVTCYANIKDIQSSIKDLLDEYFNNNMDGRKPAYSIIIEQRMNSSLVKSVVIQLIGELVGTRGIVDLKHPKLVIMVQILKNVAGLSIIRNYYERNKLNFNKK